MWTGLGSALDILLIGVVASFSALCGSLVSGWLLSGAMGNLALVMVLLCLLCLLACVFCEVSVDLRISGLVCVCSSSLVLAVLCGSSVGGVLGCGSVLVDELCGTMSVGVLGVGSMLGCVSVVVVSGCSSGVWAGVLVGVVLSVVGVVLAVVGVLLGMVCAVGTLLLVWCWLVRWVASCRVSLVVVYVGLLVWSGEWLGDGLGASGVLGGVEWACVLDAVV